MPWVSQFGGDHQAAKSFSMGVIELFLFRMASLASKEKKNDHLSANLVERGEVVHRNPQT